MNFKHPNAPDHPDRRITWSIYMLVVGGFCLIFGGFAPSGLLPFLSGGAWFWISVVLGGAIALIVNLLRPRYERTHGRWRSFYDFLLNQMAPPD